MDLSALLAREGIQADDADVLVAWARQRAAALVARIEPGSALAQQLGATLEQARSQPDGTAADVPVALTRPTSRGSSRPGRSVSRPYLGAAVQAALSRNEPALERALAISEQALGPGHIDVAASLADLADLELHQQRPLAAMALAVRAIAVYDAHVGVQVGEATAHLYLARALLAGPGDRTRARAEAQTARELAGPGEQDLRAEVDAWLRDLD